MKVATAFLGQVIALGIVLFLISLFRLAPYLPSHSNPPHFRHRSISTMPTMEYYVEKHSNHTIESERSLLQQIAATQNNILQLQLNTYKAITNTPDRPIEPSIHPQHTTTSSANMNHPFLNIPKTKLEEECENRYGLSLIKEWKSKKETWCKDSTSSLTCYPYLQVHKNTSTNKRYDMFCEAKNFIIDFSKIYKPDITMDIPRQNRYLQYVPGVLQSSCQKTTLYNEELFMPHHRELVSIKLCNIYLVLYFYYVYVYR
jgi:hypothetical protein